MSYLSEIPESFIFDFTIFSTFFIGIILIFTTIQIIRSKSFINSLIFLSIFSTFISLFFLFLDAPDVAMTEIALGACLSTCVLLKIVKVIGSEHDKSEISYKIPASILSFLLIITLCYFGLDMPNFGAEQTPLQENISKYYIDNTTHLIGIPSMVAAVLASFRGFDTLGETIVILIAGLGILLIMNNKTNSDEPH